MSITDIFRKILTVKVKEPETICPKHGNTKGFNINFTGTSFCLYCIKEKIRELGVCEVVTEKDRK